jgi:hypothetical protein
MILCDDIITCDPPVLPVITSLPMIPVCTHNHSRTSEWIFMKFVMDVMPVEVTPKSYSEFPIVNNTNVMDVQIYEVGG